MRMMETVGKYAAMILVLSWSTLAYGQTAQQQAGTSPHSLGGFVGITDLDRGDSELTIGAEYDYRLDGQWSVGGILEHIPDGFMGRDSTRLLGVVNYRPAGTPRLKFIGGAGVDFNDFGDDVRLRAGLGYDAVEGPVTLTPRLALDFGNSRQDIILGITASFGL